MEFKSFFKIRVLLLALLMLSCEKEDITVLDTEYISGGIGTSQSTGAVEFNFNIPDNYAIARVRIELQEANVFDEVNGNGDKQIRFKNVSSGLYNYAFEFWATENNYSVGDEVGVPLSKYFIINQMVEVRNGKTLKIEIDLD
tara:strand:- start:5890 stop:6315 length:426 start_codon:yes stop_codon:yes gene_type:complete